MADLSDFMEDRLLEVVFGKGAYQVPTLIRVTAVDDTATYTVRVNEVDYTYVAQAADTDVEILDGLIAAMAAATEFTFVRFTDGDAVETLILAQTAPYVSQRVAVTVDNAGALAASQDVYIALYTTAVGEDASGTEVAGSGYARQSLPMNVVAGGTTTNPTDVTFGPAGVGGWGTITHAAVFDAFTGGNLLFHAALVATKTIPENDKIGRAHV